MKYKTRFTEDMALMEDGYLLEISESLVGAFQEKALTLTGPVVESLRAPGAGGRFVLMSKVSSFNPDNQVDASELLYNLCEADLSALADEGTCALSSLESGMRAFEVYGSFLAPFPLGARDS